MSKGDPVDREEEVVRAYRHPYWDAQLKRATPSAFMEEQVSVSRLAILDLAHILAICQQDFDERVRPDGSSMSIRAFGRAKVADIIRQAELPMPDKKVPNLVLTVVEDQVENEPGLTDNPAHALIKGWCRDNLAQPRRISRGVANRLLNVFGWEPLAE